MSSSDSEEFFDLEEAGDTANPRDIDKSPVGDGSVFFSPDTTLQPPDVPEPDEKPVQAVLPEVNIKPPETVFKEPGRPRPTTLAEMEKKSGLFSSGNIEKRRQKLEELRKHMLKDEEDLQNGSPPGSQTSSVDGIYAANKPSHPFRVVDHDAISLQSTVSLGRVGRILGSEPKNASITNSKENISRAPTPEVKSSKEAQPIAIVVSEPDIVASTKSSVDASPGPVDNPQENLSVAVGIAVGLAMKSISHPEPVAPPRRKRKPKASTSDAASVCSQQDSPVLEAIPSPATTVEFLTKELEYSLDLKAVSRGQFVVKPQDEESTRAEGCISSSETISSTGSRPNDIPQKEDSVSSVPGIVQEDAVSCQLNMFVRTRTDSGKPLTDMEILEQVTVRNLDTGEQVPLSIAEDKLPRCINPLSLHIMRLTSEYVSNTSLDKQKESDEESVDMRKTCTDQASEGDTVSMRKKTSQLKRFLGSTVKKTVDKAKMIAHEVSHARHKEEVIDIPDELTGGEQHVKMKASSSHKGPYEFDTLQCVQEIAGEHVGPVWCMKFSPCGRLLATAGQDRILRIWVLKAAFSYFQDMRSRYNADSKSSPTPSQESLVSQHSSEDAAAMASEAETDLRSPFVSRPFCVYAAHTSDLLDVAWSKNYFILSSSMDKTVRLWHISRKECLCCFQHIDFVTAIAFHPRDDRYFLSGSLDGKLRLWNIPDKKVALWNELDGQTKLITAANFCQNGKFAVVGSYDGRCIFYTTEQLKYHTQIHVRSTRGKNAKGRKITGIEPMPNEDKILVTSNDSRIRLYDLRDLNLSCKYRGYVNNSSQIRASFSHDGKYIVSGSENQYIYKWKTHHDYAKFASARRDRNDYWEAIKAHNAVVTSVIFAPDPNFIIAHMDRDKRGRDEEVDSHPSRGRGSIPKKQSPLDVASTSQGYVLVSADFNGIVKVFVNRVKPKHSSLPVSALA